MSTKRPRKQKKTGRKVSPKTPRKKPLKTGAISRRKRPKLTKRQIAARKGAKTRAQNAAFLRLMEQGFEHSEKVRKSSLKAKETKALKALKAQRRKRKEIRAAEEFNNPTKIHSARVLRSGEESVTMVRRISEPYAAKSGDWYAQQMEDLLLEARRLQNPPAHKFWVGFIYRVSTRDSKNGSPIWDRGEHFFWHGGRFLFEFDKLLIEAKSMIESFADGETHGTRVSAYRLHIIALLVRMNSGAKHERAARRRKKKNKG